MYIGCMNHEKSCVCLFIVGYKIIEFANPRLSGLDWPPKYWPLSSFSEAVALSLAYVVLIAFLCLIMRNKKSEEQCADLNIFQRIKKQPLMLFVVAYNLVQVGLCAWMVYTCVLEAYNKNYVWSCNPFRIREPGMARIVWIFYLSKVLDYLDTVFIVVRGKWRQLSFLHVYHHFSVMLIYWINLNGGYDGDVYYTVVLNGGIHVVMYTYYLLRVCNVPVPMPLKALVTRAQMLQFVLMNVQGVYVLYFDCQYPARIVYMYLVYVFSLLLLFQNFASKTYTKKDAARLKANKKD
eukprot:Platyproteum_vivax@DN6842_c0_g1_i2.p1